MSGGQCTTEECAEITAGHLCHFCTGRLRAALRDLVERALAAELHTAALRQTRLTRPGDSTTRASGDRPMPVDVEAVDLGRALVDTLATWVRDVAASMPPHPVEGPVCHQCAGAPLPPHHTCAEVIGTRSPAAHPSALAQWLAANIPHIRTQRFAGQLLDEITAIIRAVEAAVDLPTPTILAGTCPQCDRPVYTRQGSTLGRCRAPDCDGTVDVAQGRADHLDRLSTTHHTAADAARILTTLGHPITRQRINQWHKRGRLTAASWGTGRSTTTDQARPRFLLADIRHLLHQPPTTTKGRTMAQDKPTPTRYRFEIHTTTGDVHTGPWQTLTPAAAEKAAETFRPMVEGPVSLETDTGDHIIVPAPQIASLRVVADQHSRKKTTR